MIDFKHYEYARQQFVSFSYVLLQHRTFRSPNNARCSLDPIQPTFPRKVLKPIGTRSGFWPASSAATKGNERRTQPHVWKLEKTIHLVGKRRLRTLVLRLVKCKRSRSSRSRRRARVFLARSHTPTRPGALAKSWVVPSPDLIMVCLYL